MRKAIAFLLTFSVFACSTEESAGPASADTFIKLFGGSNIDIGSSAMQTDEGGFIILGTTETENDDGTSSFQIRLIKTDANGNESWDRLFPEDLEEGISYTGNSLIPTDEGYLIVGDRIYPSGKTSMVLLQVNSSGNEVMSKPITITESEDTLSLHGIDLAVNQAGELKVTGSIETDSEEDIYVGTVSLSDLTVMPTCSSRYSSAGSDLTVLKSTYIEDNGDVVFGLAVRNNSRFIRVPGCQKTPLGGPLIQSESTNTYTASQVIKSSIGYAMIGTTTENVNRDIFLVKLNTKGESTLLKIYTEIDGVTLSNDEEGLAIASTADGGFIFGGSTLSSTQGELDMIIVKTDFFGNVEWSQRFGDQNEETVTYITQTTDGGYLILGNTEFGGIDTMVLIKTDNKGNVN